MADTTSPLDAALESVEREDLGGAAVKDDSAETADPFAAPPALNEQSAPKKRGRPVNPNGRAAQRAARRAGNVAVSGKISDPPVPDVKPDFAKIAPESVAQSIRQIDAILVKLTGTSPLSPEEASAGGGVFAPVLDHYMPLMAEKGGMWLAPLTWVIIAYGPRAYEVLDRRQQAIAAEKRGVPPKGAQSGEAGKTDFPRSVDDDPARPFSVVAR